MTGTPGWGADHGVGKLWIRPSAADARCRGPPRDGRCGRPGAARSARRAGTSDRRPGRRGTGPGSGPARGSGRRHRRGVRRRRGPVDGGRRGFSGRFVRSW
ncbi:hypothetical protein FDO65_18185 [Nakamurella flava]|uniref:Uncharacterized protein n=1 Tax=Nakamurella flava TaxID=2576308 RepID=A0A4U6QA39_9ACTN|nr:hypothetical protein FDO65_18185 [Nakamurella flava]